MGLSVAFFTPWAVRCGIFTYTRNLINALAKLDVDCYVVRLPRFGRKTSEILQNVVDSIPVEKVDLIHVQHEYGLYQKLEGGFYGALKRFGKPIVTTCHAVGNWEVDRVIAEASDRVIVHNEYCARRFGHPCVIIPHGCVGPFKCPAPDECKRALGIDPRAPLVGYVGFISSYKGLEMLVEAMAEIRNAGLLVGGGWHAVGAETQYITQLKQRSLEMLPGRCQWLGYIPDERLSTVYGAVKLIVYPSRFITESGALLMALSHGKAVVASDLKPVREKAKQGALMTFRSVRDLTRKIKRLLKDEELRSELEEGAWKYAEENSWAKVGEKHISLYTQVITECSVKETKGNG